MDYSNNRYCGFAVGNIFRLADFQAKRKKDIATDAKADATLISDIGYIKSGIDDLKRQQQKTEERHIEIITRLTAVEASAKQAHKRIDTLQMQERNE